MCKRMWKFTKNMDMGVIFFRLRLYYETMSPFWSPRFRNNHESLRKWLWKYGLSVTLGVSYWFGNEIGIHFGIRELLVNFEIMQLYSLQAGATPRNITEEIGTRQTISKMWSHYRATGDVYESHPREKRITTLRTGLIFGSGRGDKTKY